MTGKFWCGWVVALAAAAAAHGQEITFGRLLDEMLDLGRLAEYPDPSYTNRQFSSYDQRSTDPAVATDENWFANGDRGQILREEQRNGATEYVLMDTDGPGAIVRFWSADPVDAGIVRIYLDNQPEPAIEMNLEDMLRGNTAPFIAPIANEVSAGWNSYLPIPYSTHCKVTASQRDFYYHLNYRTYEAGTTVRTFSMAEARAMDNEVARIATFLSNLGQRGFADPAAAQYTALEPGAVLEQTHEWRKPQAITRFAAHVKADDVAAALRGCLLEIYFDDYDIAAVSVPLGDFFGSAPGIHPYTSLPSGVMDDGVMYSLWVMPYRKSMKLRVTNHSGQSLELALELTKSDYNWTKNTLYFHANWRGEQNIPTQPRQDWNFLIAAGKGRFVGTMLHISNPAKGWWGEGDEKIYVDHEPFPSTFGTGSEDYFGYAWGSPAYYTHAYHAQPNVDGPGNYGNTCDARYHIMDDIPFTSSFRFDMEIWHWVDCKISQSAISYWYGAPGSTSNLNTPRAEALVVPFIPELPAPPAIEGAIEGETLRQVSVSGGTTTTQGDMLSEWSRGEHLWWMDGAVGDVLTLAVPVETAGRYEVFVRLTKSWDYAIVQPAVNGVKAGPAIDLYSKDVIAAPEQSLGVFDLPQGDALLSFEIVGMNPESQPRHMLGLDYVKVVAK